MRTIAGVRKDGKFKAKRDVEGKLWSYQKHMTTLKWCLMGREEKLMKELKIISMLEWKYFKLFKRVCWMELQQHFDDMQPYKILDSFERSNTGERMVAKR
jgi:hypothetical protein